MLTKRTGDVRDSVHQTLEEIAQEIHSKKTLFLKSVYTHITKIYLLAVDLGILNSAVSGDMCNMIAFQFITMY